jgi:hypothetical protein
LAIFLVPKPIITIIGGIQRTPIEGSIMTTTCCVAQLGGLTLPVWAAIAAAAVSKGMPGWQSPASGDNAPPRLHSGLVILAISSIGIWLPILPMTQAEQLNRTRAEHALREGRIAEALADMSAHMPSDYPPQWEPPPRVGNGEHTPSVIDVMEIVVEKQPAPWVREIYIEKLDRFLDVYSGMYDRESVEPGRLLQLLQKLTEGKSLFIKHRTHVERVYGDPGKLTAEARKFLGPLPDAKRQD